MRSTIYRTHLWLGLIVAVPVLAWTSSGLLYAWPNAVEGGQIENIAPGRVRVTPAEAMQRADDFVGRKLPTTALTLADARRSSGLSGYWRHGGGFTAD
jgi:hypothetical protein